MTESLFIDSHPVFEVDGEVKGDLGYDVLRIEIEEGTNGLKHLCARFLAIGSVEGGRHQEHVYVDGSVFDFGREIVVSIGPSDGARTVFRGFVSGIEACYEEAEAPEVVVYAEDRLMDLRMTRRSRTYEQMSDAEIAEQVAGEHGLAAEVDAEGPTYDVVQQWNMSDLAFLRDRARRVQAEVWFADDTLHFKSRGARRGPELTLVQGNDLVRLTVRADLAHQRTKVRVSGYDAQDRTVIDEEATADVVAREIESGRTGPDVLESAFGDRVSHRVRDVPLVAGEARAFAESEMLRRARAFVVAHGVTSGSPDLVVGSRVRLENVGLPFAGGGYYVTRVRHTFDRDQGHRTEFQAERATIEELR